MSLLQKIQRWQARRVHCRPLPRPDTSIVTFGFDDCPRSVLETALPLLEERGWRATIYVSMGLCGTTNHLGLHLSREEIIEIAARGHEIADHTYSHISAQDVTTAELFADIARNQAALADIGVTPVDHFALPFGKVDSAGKLALSTRFKTVRGVVSPDNAILDANLLPAMRLYSGDALYAVLHRIAGLPAQPSWLNLFGHDVRPEPSQFGCTAEDLARVIKAVKLSGATVLPVGAAYDRITSDTWRSAA